MAAIPLSRTHYTMLLLAIILLVGCLVQPSQSMPGSSLDSPNSFFSRDPTPISPGVANSRTGASSRNGRCQTPSQCSGDDNNEEGDDEESDAPEYEPSDFSKAPRKEEKVAEAETDAKAKGSPNADAPNICKAKDRCSGECCDDGSEHCAHMALRSKKTKQLRLKWRTCCPKKQVAGHNGHCCLPEKLVKGACRP